MPTAVPSPGPSSSKSKSPSPDAAEVEAAGGGKWRSDEDERLVAAVSELGVQTGVWKEISRRVGGPRNDKSCKKRWTHSLDPSLRKGRWTAEEDAILLEHYAEVGSHWHKIAAFIPGRKADQVAKRYRDTLDPSLDAQAPWTAEEDRTILAAHEQVGPLWTLICAKVGTGRSGMHVRNRWRTLTRSPALSRKTSDGRSTPTLTRTTSDGRPASRERSSEAGPSRRARSTTSSSAVGRTGSPASRTEALREDLPSPPTADATSSNGSAASPASPFNFDKYYAAIPSPATHVTPPFGDVAAPSLNSLNAPFTEIELAFLRAYPPPPQDHNGDVAMDWAGLDNFVPPPLAPPTFPSPLSQAPMTHGLVVCTHCHGSGVVSSSTDYLGVGRAGASPDEGAAGAAGWPGMHPS